MTLPVDPASQVPLRFFCDEIRHLVCYPFSVDNLHAMATFLGIKRCWFHNSPRHPHYDIPKRRIAEISAKCEVVPARQILMIMKGHAPPCPPTNGSV